MKRTILSHMKIAVVDDHDLIREGMKAVLINNGAKHVDLFSASSHLISAMDRGVKYNFYIIDLELPDIEGFVLIEMIRARDSEAKIIVSTVHDEIWTLRRLLAKEVNGIVYKSGEGIEIIDAISEIIDGKRYFCHEVQDSLKLAADNSMHPSARELEVLRQIAHGKTSREIAAAMFVSDNTVEAHRKALFTKLGAVNVADLIMKAINKGYLKKGN